MATTTNYSWTTPDDTALVKDGAAAIRTLGSSVDTTVKNLNPETTLGDIAYRSSTANVKTRLGLGTAGQVLQVNSGATAPEWATPAAGGGYTLLSTTNLSSTATTISGISGSYQDLLLLVQDVTANTTADLQFDPNSTTQISFVTGIRGTTVGNINDLAISFNQSGEQIPTSNTNASYQLYIFNYANSSYAKPFLISGNATSTANTTINGGGSIRDTNAITSMRLKFRNGQTFTGGRVLVYGVN